MTEEYVNDNVVSIEKAILADVCLGIPLGKMMFSLPGDIDPASLDHVPDTFLFRGEHLSMMKARYDQGDEQMIQVVDELANLADEALKIGSFAVTDKPKSRFSDDPHDYQSLAKYSWPNPESDSGLPYVTRDGEVNPDCYDEDLDYIRLVRFSERAVLLALAAYFTGKSAYGRSGAELLHTWFVDPQTRQTPHFRFAQVSPGREGLRWQGIIEGRFLVYVTEAAQLLAAAGALTPALCEETRGWFAALLDWLLESEHGQKAMNARNNIGFWYDLQCMVYAQFCGRAELAEQIARERVATRLSKQLSSDGTLPVELARSYPQDYVAFTLAAMALIARTGERAGLKLWTQREGDGRNFQAAHDWLLKAGNARQLLSKVEFAGTGKDSRAVGIDVLFDAGVKLRAAHRTAEIEAREAAHARAELDKAKALRRGHEAEIAALRRKLAASEAELRSVLTSTSWRMTVPVRAVVRRARTLGTAKRLQPVRQPEVPSLSTFESDRALANLSQKEGRRPQPPESRLLGRKGGRNKSDSTSGNIVRGQGAVTVSATNAEKVEPRRDFGIVAFNMIRSIARQKLPKSAKVAIKKLVKSRNIVNLDGALSTFNDVDRAANYIIGSLNSSNMKELFNLKAFLDSRMATEEGFLLRNFFAVVFCKKISAFAFSVQAADHVLDRYSDRGLLSDALGEKAYGRFIADAAISMTRVGRYEDARALLDREIANGLVTMLPVRAEVSWIHDPDQAARDLRDHAGKGGVGRLKKGDGLLYRHLSLNVLDRPDGAPAVSEGGEFLLVVANRSLKDGRQSDYRTLLNRFFEEQELAAPLAVSEEPISFEQFVSNASQAVDSGPLVSIVMTTHNSSSTVRYAVRSILQQTYRNFELLIVDDCSGDDTRELLAHLAAEDPRVKVLHNERNLGTYGAKNRAIEMAGGDYITCHDSDDWAHPQRIETHVKEMQANPNLVATRSNWLRLDSSGKIDFRRWNKRFSHPNPASMFFRSEVLQKVGYFDLVKFGADTEYLARVKWVYGPDSIKGISQTLALGCHHESSLTQGGAGAMGIEHYSPARSAYRFSQCEWHGRRPASELHFDHKSRSRKFWAPESALGEGLPANDLNASLARLYPGLDENRKVPNFIFGISLASKRAVEDWAHTEHLLGRTLRSVLKQADPRFRVIICGHERPEIPELDDPRVIFMVADIEPPASSDHFRKDKMWKRRLVGAALRNMGGGYFFPLDADDLVHKDLVSYVLSEDNRRGYNINQGYVEDFLNRRLAPVPGAWSVPFDRVCGSSAVLYFEPDELPRDGHLDANLYFNLFQSHAYWPIVAEESGKPLATVPFPAAVYVVNHSQNLSFGLQRAGQRTKNIISSVERCALADGRIVLQEKFAQTSHPGD